VAVLAVIHMSSPGSRLGARVTSIPKPQFAFHFNPESLIPLSQTEQLKGGSELLPIYCSSVDWLLWWDRGTSSNGRN